jgi:predicted ATPase
MKLERLHIENFKCFKSEKTFDFGRITVLAGANSSGKSSVMSSILAIAQSDNFPKHFAINGRYVSLGDFKQIVYNHKTENVIKIGLRFQSYDYDFFTYWSEDETSFQPILTKTIAPTSNGELDKMEFIKKFSIENLTKQYRFKVNFIGAFRQPPSRTYLEKNFADLTVDTEGGGYLDQIVAWEKVKSPKLKELIEKMSEIDLLKEIKTNRFDGGRFELLVKVSDKNVLTSLSNVGFGISQFLPIIVADLQLPNDSTLFLAEPEIHLHPSVQSKFGEYIVKQVNETEKNYVIETHSEYFLNRLRLAIVKGELRKEDLKVYFLENNGDDTEVYDIDYTKEGAIKNAPKSYFKTYMSDTMDIALHAFAE